eukprot:g8237.t1
MCKKLSCLAIAVIAAGAVVLIGTVVGLSVHFANAGKDTEKEIKPQPGVGLYFVTGRHPRTKLPKPPAPVKETPKPPAKETSSKAALVEWVGGPQNEVKGVSEMLGTQYIEYRRDYQQFLAEQDYEKDLTDDATRSTLKAFPLRIDVAKQIDENDEKTHKHMRSVLRAAEDRAGTKAKGRGGASLRFVMSAKAKAGSSKMIKAQNLAHDLIAAGKYAQKAKTLVVKASEIAIVVAADGGLPGGIMSKLVDEADGKTRTAEANIEKIHNGHDEDEEGSVVSNWYVHQARAYPAITQKKFGEKRNPAADRVFELFNKALQGKWGLLVHTNPAKHQKDSYETAQGVDYVHTRNPVAFADCWVVRYARIGQEKATPQLWTTKKDDHAGKKVQNPDKATPKLTGKAYPYMKTGGHKIAALLFVPAPNGNASNVPSSTEASLVSQSSPTLNKYATENVNFFKASLQASVVAALDAAIREQLLYKNPIKVLVLEKLGAALHWPRDATSGKRSGEGGAAKAVYKKIIDAALDEMVEVENVAGVEGGKKQLPKRAFFDDVVMSHDGRQ